MMLTVVPYTRLYRDTVEALPDAHFIRVQGDHGYRELLGRLWEGGQAFILVEHDVAPTADQLQALADCPEPWCHYGYCAGDWTPTFGCVRFSAEIIAALPDVWNDESWPWCQLDAKFHVYAREHGWKPHWHYPHVLHTRWAYLDTDGIEQRIRLTPGEELYVLTAATAILKDEIEGRTHDNLSVHRDHDDADAESRNRITANAGQLDRERGVAG